MKYIIPSIITIIILFALKTRTGAYEAFIDGAEDGMKIVMRIFPALISIMCAASMLRASGSIDMITNLFAPITDFFKIPREVMPLVLIRPISGSGALGILADILNNFGADSKAGLTASVIMGSTETTFYCLCVYFAATKVKYTKRVIPCTLIGDIIGIITGVIVINLKNF